MESYFFTGNTGFLGRLLSYSIESKWGPIKSMDSVFSNRIDISKPFFFPDNSDFNIVIHCAGKAHSVPKTKLEEREFYDVNYQGTINLCDALDKLVTKPRAFVFISTIAVYGLDHGLEISENTPLLGNTPYARSKIEAEQYLSKWANKNNIILGIVRLPLVVGPNPPGNLGTMLKGIKTGRYLSIGTASAKKSVVWAEDIADIIPKIAKIGGVYNLTDGHHPSFSELENEICRCLGRNKPFRIPLSIALILGKIGNLLGRKSPINTDKVKKITSSLTFDDTNARGKLGWNPSKVLDRIIEIF